MKLFDFHIEFRNANIRTRCASDKIDEVLAYWNSKLDANNFEGEERRSKSSEFIVDQLDNDLHHNNNEIAYDCVAAGTTVTAERETKAQFVPPYLISGQSLAVDTVRLPEVKSIDDLAGLTIGVQQGNTSQPIAEALVAHGKAQRVRVYGTIRTALTDLTTGGCDAFMKLAPVLTELVKPLPGVEVVQRGISVEDIALAVGLGDQALLARITVAQTELECNGTLPRIRQKWLGNSDADQSSAVH